MTYRLKVIKLEDVPPIDKFLTQREIKMYDDFKVEKRRSEWLCGRYALKLLATDFFAFDMLQMEVHNVSSGKPVLLVPGGTHLPVSITHSGEYGAAAIAMLGDNIGVDIEVIEERGKEWADMCFHEDELSSTDSAFLTELWVKKEAILKFLGIGLSIDMKNIRFIEGQLSFYGKAFDIWAQLGSPKIETSVLDLDGGYKLAAAFEVSAL
jgi:4'-phosphopantetheinyl transferase